MRKILFFFNSSEDFKTSRLALVTAVKNEGVQVFIAMPDVARISPEQYTEFQFFNLSLDRQSIGIISQIKTLLGIYKIFKKVEPDLVLLFRVKIIFLGGLLSRIKKIPLICVFTGLGYVFSSSSVKAKFSRNILRIFYQYILPKRKASVVFQNPDNREIFINLGIVTEEQSIVILGSGVDIKKFSYTNEPKNLSIKILLLSRMLWDKGIAEYIEAARIIKSQMQHCEFILAGGIDEFSKTAINKNILMKWQKESLITWLGSIPPEEVPALIKNTHIVCLPSYSEGLPRVLLEGAASGRPLIACDIPGCREVIKNNKNGFLIPAKDPKALAEVIKKLVESSELRQQMGKYSRELAEALFSSDEIIEQYLELIKDQLQ
jgi:glycosyltransferase involved in cell wall biosynthesis